MSIVSKGIILWFLLSAASFQDPEEKQARTDAERQAMADLDQLRVTRKRLVLEIGEGSPAVAELDEKIAIIEKAFPSLRAPLDGTYQEISMIQELVGLVHERGKALALQGKEADAVKEVDRKIRLLQESMKKRLPAKGCSAFEHAAGLSAAKIEALSGAFALDRGYPSRDPEHLGKEHDGLKLSLKASISEKGDVVLDVEMKNLRKETVRILKPAFQVVIEAGKESEKRKVHFTWVEPQPAVQTWPYVVEDQFEKLEGGAVVQKRLSVNGNSLWVLRNPKICHPPGEDDKLAVREGKLTVVAGYTSSGYGYQFAKGKPPVLPRDWESAVYLHPEVSVKLVEGAWSGGIWSNDAEVTLSAAGK